MRRITTIILLAAAAWGQQTQDENRTRGVWDADFRPQVSGKKTAAPLHKAAPKLVGVTLWRMRPSTADDGRAVRMLVHEGGEQREFTPERIEVNTPLTEGQHVRVGIETSQAGYLYVVDQEEYADKSRSEPYLIFPTLRLRGGDNHVMAGVVVEIPAGADNPPYLTVKRARPDQVAEVLTILVSPRPIAEVKIGMESQKLSRAKMAEWEKQWTAGTYHLEEPGQAGKAYTAAEKEAGAGNKKLAAGDPLPQTMYKVDAKSGDPLLIHLPLQIAK